MVQSLPGVDVLTASAENGAPEVAWGDSFFYYDPDRSLAPDRRFPFATLVVQDYAGFDTASDVNRPGVFRVNISVGRESYAKLFGHPPAEHADHHDSYDYTVLDQVIPHPVYAKQGWVSILSPAATSADQLRSLLAEAHARVARRHRGQPATEPESAPGRV